MRVLLAHMVRLLSHETKHFFSFLGNEVIDFFYLIEEGEFGRGTFA